MAQNFGQARQHIHTTLRTNAVPILMVAVFSPLPDILVLNAMPNGTACACRPHAQVVHHHRFPPRLPALSGGPSRAPHRGCRSRADRNRRDQSLMLFAALVRIHQLMLN